METAGKRDGDKLQQATHLEAASFNPLVAPVSEKSQK